MTRKEASDHMWFISDAVIEQMAEKYGTRVFPDTESTESTVGKMYGLIALDNPIKSERGDWFDSAVPVIRGVMKDGAERWVYSILTELLQTSAPFKPNVPEV